MTSEEIYLQKRFLELGKRSQISSQFLFTGFLQASDISLLHETCQKEGFVYTLFGGMENTERQRARFGDPDELGYQVPFPIVVMIIKPSMEKYAEELNHRDYLGALMNLGIKRETLGDIYIKGKTAYLFADEKMADYIEQNLSKVRHTSVKVVREYDVPPQLCVKKEERELLVSSIRLDVIVAARYKMSRSQSLLLFKNQKIFVNGRVCENNSYQVKEDDVISVRGHGKMIFKHIAGETRKGRIYILVEDFA